MKIRDLSIEIFSREAPRISTAQARFRPSAPQHLGLLRLTTEDGLEGNSFLGVAGEADLKSLATQAANLVKRELAGKDASDREWLWSQLRYYTFYGRMSYLAWSAVDVALWDLAGKAAGSPVYKLLGAQRHSIPAYASSPYYPEVQGYVEEVLRYKEAGYTAYKIHPAGVPVTRVKEIASQVRKAAGDQMYLMVDASLCYDYEDALAIGKHLESLNYHWFEDPVRYSDFDAIDELARRLDIPIAVTDYPDFRFHEAAQMIRRNNGVRIIRGDSMKEGITGLKKLCSLAEAFGMKCEVHSSVNSLMNVANLHV
ncbi:MAG: mandelate racemase, partial [Chloroflexi bacterium]|nr:mandelate racemase [Chloroflexota bacterium]